MTSVYPSCAAIEALQLELSLLQVLHHRNKNQHHLQPFFKHLSILKRDVSLLIHQPNSVYVLNKLRKVSVIKAWEEFSRVVSRGEYVPLGLILCASVARVAASVGGIDVTDGCILGQESINENTEIYDEEMGEVIPREPLSLVITNKQGRGQ
jgi:hypothetical protein